MHEAATVPIDAAQALCRGQVEPTAGQGERASPHVVTEWVTGVKSSYIQAVDRALFVRAI